MKLIEKVLSLAIKDMKGWFRQPFLIVIAVLPVLIISLFVGWFTHQAEILPAGVILQDRDPLALQLKEILTQMKSGSGRPWFAMTRGSKEKVLAQFKQGKILTYILIPARLSARLKAGKIVKVQAVINNINDDVTKNVMQRLQYACNLFHHRLKIGSISSKIPQIKFIPLSPVDVSFAFYVVAAVLALTVLLSSGVNIATTTANEFESETIKELVMAPPLAGVVLGKIITTFLQTAICFLIVLAESYLVFGFVPKGNPLLLVGMIAWGILSFASLGFLVATLLKKVVPAALVILLLNIAGWWIGGGLVPSEVWTGFLQLLSSLWPGTYFYRSFVSLLLLGEVSPSLLMTDLLITGVFGLVTFGVALILFQREARSC